MQGKTAVAHNSKIQPPYLHRYSLLPVLDDVMSLPVDTVRWWESGRVVFLAGRPVFFRLSLSGPEIGKESGGRCPLLRPL
jgi:hypothetical protein